MPTLEEQFSDAIEKLRRQVQAAVDPVLDDPDELTALLNQTRRAKVWVTATVYSYGDVIVPSIGNGHSFRCLIGGTSGATEPEWGSVLTITDNQQFTDGDDILWQEDGVGFDNVYDVRAATCAGWMLKAAKASADVDNATGDDNAKDSQLHDHCLAQARRWEPVGVW